MASAHETEKSPAELEVRVWELAEKLRFCIFSTWNGDKQHQRPLTAMPDKETIRKARADKRAGKSPSTQAGEFVHDEIDKIRHGEHGARSAKQAIAIGLSEARRAG